MAAKKVFYAWQSDRPRRVTRDFIHDAIQAAIANLNADAEVEDADDVDGLQIDHDTNGVPGTPAVAETICKKIDACAVFVADVTVVGEYKIDQNRTKKVANGNVLVECGYARARRGLDFIILVQNTHYGSARELPFDLNQLRHPIAYDAGPNVTDANRNEALKQLANKFVTAIQAAMDCAKQNDDQTSEASFKENLADPRKEYLVHERRTE